MVTQDYIDGFNKTAEKFGLDPQALMKEAGFGAFARLIARMQPKVRLRGKFDPRRLFTSTRHNVIQRAENAVAGSGGGAASGRAGASEYGDAGIPRWSEVPNKGGVRDVTRLSPAKVVAALLGLGGTAAAASGGSAPAAPAQALAGNAGLYAKLLAALGGTALVGGGAYAASRADDEKDKKRKKG